MIWFFLVFINPVYAAAPVDWIERSPSGAYRFGYATGDSGGHYRQEAATLDNTIAGKFGSRDPASGANLETTYTSGRRGFRARGPHIARRMGLSQIGGPLRPKDDGQYHPEFDNVFDPSEDRGYDFQFRTKDVVKEEHADSRGDVHGRYSYIDDIGGHHSVEYTAGSNTGFNVVNPAPDTFSQAQGSPLVFHGRGPGSRKRGFTAFQRGFDGSYKFAASGPDHKRSEVSDAVGNRRGSYTYLDDKGVQRTVEYIAGPNIGFQVINNRRPLLFKDSPIPSVIPTLSPFFPDLPSSTPYPLFPDPRTTLSSLTPIEWTTTKSTEWPSSTPTWLDITADYGILRKPETLNTASSDGIKPFKNFTDYSCCGKNWRDGPHRGSTNRGKARFVNSDYDDGSPRRAFRAFIQNIGISGDHRHMSPSEALDFYGQDPVEHRARLSRSDETDSSETTTTENSEMTTILKVQ